MMVPARVRRNLSPPPCTVYNAGEGRGAAGAFKCAPHPIGEVMRCAAAGHVAVLPLAASAGAVRSRAAPSSMHVGRGADQTSQREAPTAGWVQPAVGVEHLFTIDTSDGGLRVICHSKGSSSSLCMRDVVRSSCCRFLLCI